jgi:phosphoribosylformylglycinamidine synthase
MNAIRNVMDDGLVASCHDISDGGLAVALTESCIGGKMGADVEFYSSVDKTVELFSETPTRWIIEVTSGCDKEFEARLRGIDIVKIGNTCGSHLTIRDSKQKFINIAIEKLEQNWRKPIWDIMG